MSIRLHSAAQVTAVPFAAWGNSAPGGMRVRLPAQGQISRQLEDEQLVAEVAETREEP